MSVVASVNRLARRYVVLFESQLHVGMVVIVRLRLKILLVTLIS